MLVATSVARDTRVLREAESLVGAGYEVLIIGRDIPVQFQAQPGITLYSASSGQGLRPAAMAL